ncbi:Bulb-type lectin domain-containing protein [Artemisia annua]|uniref:Bulb-type lectin domain-containing protein n=1 Tax=Artemisia annua TaxID=35608 RepID=A0A2U1Q4X9_ARTAN|nr:Bulb-type lectin domain-containing protein [Artemisia annua]
MNLLFSLAILIHFSSHFYGHCTTDNLQLGAKTTLVVPSLYIIGFVAQAFVLETSQPVPNFRAGLSIEAIDQKYLCSLDIFLGDFKVWSTSHFSRFFTYEKCVIDFTMDGDLRLTGHDDEMGWRTATFGQGIKSLQLSNTGNLVLVDELNNIKWQSFHFPTNVMLWGQTLNVGTELTSFPTNSTSFYSFEIHREKLALYLNSGKFKYSYWEFSPKPQNISFIRLATDGLLLLNDDSHKIAQIPSKRLQLLRFLAVENTTGNLGFYYYSTTTKKLEASFHALRSKCDEPNFCQVNEICTFSNECSTLEIKGISGNFCGTYAVEMKDIRGVTSILRDENKKTVNTTKETCSSSCIEDCTCVGALFISVSKECYMYGEIKGMKVVNLGEEMSFMVKNHGAAKKKAIKSQVEPFDQSHQVFSLKISRRS